MDKSKFSMWRASFAFCHVDSVLSSEEREWIEAKLKSLPFFKEEKEIIEKDMKSPPDIESILGCITNPVDKGFLVNEIRKLAHIDKDLSPAEKEKISRIQQMVMSKLDVSELEKKVEHVIVPMEEESSALFSIFSRRRKF